MLKVPGTYQGNEASNPTLGKKGEMHKEAETQISMTFAKHLESRILKTLFEVHPYEEVAYEIKTLENTNQHIGMGMVGELEHPLSEKEFLNYLKTKMNCFMHQAYCFTWETH